jgi:signal peptidase II
MRKTLPYFVLVVLILVVDQITKAAVAQNIALGTSRSIIPGFFNLSHIRNRGAIFGFFSQSSNPLVFILLTLASLGAFSLVVYYFIKVPDSERLLKITLSLVIAGALGNLIDRFYKGYVVDFLDFYVGRYHWPSFNVADSCISAGAILLLFIYFFKRGRKCSLCC